MVENTKIVASHNNTSWQPTEGSEMGYTEERIEDGSTFAVLSPEHRYGENTKSLARDVGGSIIYTA